MTTTRDAFNELCDELRRKDTPVLLAGREEAIREQRRWRAVELAHTVVLDERDALAKDQAAKDGETESRSQRKRATAKKLTKRPNLGNAAMDGDLSDDQLEPATDLVDDDEDDAEVAASAKRSSPQALSRMAREKRRERDREEARRNSMRRRNQRFLKKWVDGDGFLVGHFQLPMEHGGAIVESFFDRVAERIRPRTGEAWEPLERRQADILIALCQMEAGAADAAGSAGRDEDDRAQAATAGARVDLHVDIRLDGEATLCGVPLPSEWVDAARANARVHLRVHDDQGNLLHEERAKSFVSDKRRRAVIRRDGHCRWPGCARRLRLQVHHLQPGSWGGSDDIANLASVCPYHHQLLVPHGDHVLEGNPARPDGLTLRTITKEEREHRRLEEAA